MSTPSQRKKTRAILMAAYLLLALTAVAGAWTSGNRGEPLGVEKPAVGVEFPPSGAEQRAVGVEFPPSGTER